ncbi:hypothetical protein C368_05966 [Cryptococcus neoformans 125.91]|nr:hypothetical protein C368_05966 [Cryptococcus neoformans var. grubii 125.91]
MPCPSTDIYGELSNDTDTQA